MRAGAGDGSTQPQPRQQQRRHSPHITPAAAAACRPHNHSITCTQQQLCNPPALTSASTSSASTPMPSALPNRSSSRSYSESKMPWNCLGCGRRRGQGASRHRDSEEAGQAAKQHCGAMKRRQVQSQYQRQQRVAASHSWRQKQPPPSCLTGTRKCGSGAMGCLASWHRM